MVINENKGSIYVTHFTSACYLRYIYISYTIHVYDIELLLCFRHFFKGSNRNAYRHTQAYVCVHYLNMYVNICVYIYFSTKIFK